MPLISHDVTGAGPAVLLIHAGVADRRMWEPQLSDLTQVHRVVRVDLCGFGNSPLPPDPYDHVTDVVAVLEETGVDRVSVVGASFGGLIAQELARRHSNRVERLLLLCPASALLQPDDELKAFWSREEALLDSGNLPAATALNVDTWCGPEASPAVRKLVATMQRRSFELQAEREDLEIDEVPGDPSTIQAPSLVVTGDHDLAAFRTSAVALARALPHGQLRTLPWAGHLPSLERHDEIGQLMTGFLAG
ncbi:MAG: alpha/beta fold hydrolase [Nocardioides sp.]